MTFHERHRARKRGEGLTSEIQAAQVSPAGRYYPVPRGSVMEICRALDEDYNAGLSHPRDVRERRRGTGAQTPVRGTIKAENEAAPAGVASSRPAPDRDACKEANG